MTDEELLELAAKAAGVPCDGLGPYKEVQVAHYKNYSSNWETEHHRWEPLYDDGDALQLAVKLGFSLMHYYYEGDYFIKVPVNDVAMTEPLATDPYAATRRAIVRAAAAIGEEMK